MIPMHAIPFGPEPELGAPDTTSTQASTRYTANLMKVGAMLPETITLLAAWDGEPREIFARRMTESNLLGKTTRTRVADLLRRVFWRRFPPEATPGLRHASAFVRGFGPADASRLVCLYHAAAAEPLLADLLSVLTGPENDEEGAGLRLQKRALAGSLTTGDVVEFIRERGGAEVADWSPNTIKRTARGALAALRDFGVLEGRTQKRLRARFPVPLPAFLYVAYALWHHLATAREVALSRQWGFFLLTPANVELLFLQAHAAGHLRYYHLGDIWRIDWAYPDLASLVNALTGLKSGATQVSGSEPTEGSPHDVGG